MEALTGFAVVFNLAKSVRMSKLLGICACVMTFWKTVIFCLYSLDVGKGGHKFDLIGELMVFGFGAIWLVVPAYAAFVLMQDFLDNKTSKREKNSAEGNDVPDSPNRRYNLRKRE